MSDHLDRLEEYVRKMGETFRFAEDGDIAALCAECRRLRSAGPVLAAVRPLDCGPGKVFVLEQAGGARALPESDVARLAALWERHTGGSKLVVLPPGCKLRGGEGPTLTLRNDTDKPVTVELDLTRWPAPPADEPAIVEGPPR